MLSLRDSTYPYVGPVLLALEYAPGLGAEAIVPGGESMYARCCAKSSTLVMRGETGRGPDVPSIEECRIDLIDDRRLLLLSLLSYSDGLARSMASPKERFRVGERNEAGESDVCRSDGVASEVMGARRWSSSRDWGISLWYLLYTEYCVKFAAVFIGGREFCRSTVSGTS